MAGQGRQLWRHIGPSLGVLPGPEIVQALPGWSLTMTLVWSRSTCRRENLLITLSPSLISLGNCYNKVEGFAELLWSFDCRHFRGCMLACELCKSWRSTWLPVAAKHSLDWVCIYHIHVYMCVYVICIHNMCTLCTYVYISYIHAIYIQIAFSPFCS